jgi:hypothetical protein
VVGCILSDKQRTRLHVESRHTIPRHAIWEKLMPRRHNLPRKVADSALAATVRAWRVTNNSLSETSRQLGISKSTVGRHLAKAVMQGMLPKDQMPQTSVALAKDEMNRHRQRQYEPLFESETLPSPDAPIGELIERRKLEWARKSKAETARRLINVKVKIDGPVGIVHFGDPHVDDPGTDIVALERHLKTVKNTPGMMGGNVGDLQNNWVGRLARLYAEQSTSAKEAWVLTEWMVKEIPWLYLIGGNHDLWSGAGDPLEWISKHAGVQYEG